MTRSKKTTDDLRVKELDLAEAWRLFSRSRGRSSKYDQIIDGAKKLSAGKALVVEDIRYSEVTALRKKVQSTLGEDWTVAAAKGQGAENRFNVIIHQAQ